MPLSTSNFISLRKEGLYCKAGDFFLDPRKPVTQAVVSHAHGDHAVANHQHVYATPATQQLMRMRHGNSLFTDMHALSYGERFQLGNVAITLYPAGHMLGSAQILMEYEGKRYVYTGDFKLQQDASCESFEFISCDELITETTFADPDYSHPQPEDILEALNKVDKPLLIGAYAVGKAQRITRLMTTCCPDRVTYVHPELIAFHKCYEAFGFHLGDWKAYTRQAFKMDPRAAVIVSPGQFMRYSRNPDVYKVFATGWKKSFYRCDAVLPVSDHADWKDVLHLIERCSAKVVHTVHGNGKPLQQHFAMSGTEVRILH